jgi:integrase
MSTSHRLTLYRRHSKDCSAGYPKDLRIFEHDSAKATKKKQCACTIVAQGTLPSGKFLKHPSTGENDFARAHLIAARWWEWGDVNPPAHVVRENAQLLENHGATHVEEAVRDFLAVKKAENVSQDILSNHRIMLEDRLVPFARSKGIGYIQQMDDARCWSDFRQSWINLNPFQNRKPTTGVIPERTISPNTAKRLLGQVREFIRFAIGRGWITQEWAAPKYLKVVTKPEPKEPFSDEDVAAIFEATQFVTDRGRTGQFNSKELLVFCYVLRYAGLRISDATKLEKANLVPRPGDPKNYSLHVFQQKTKKWVFVPIPSGDIPDTPNIAAMLKSLPLTHGKYFFLGGKCVLRSNVTSWAERLTKLFRKAEENFGPLSVHPHPHRFRHTFAARLLEQGMDVRDVAEFLGDTVAVVLKHYAKYTTKQQEIAAQRWKQTMTGAAHQHSRLHEITGEIA